MASRRKVDSTTQDKFNKADNPDRRNQPQGQTNQRQSDAKPERLAKQGNRVISQGTDMPSEGMTHGGRVAHEKESNRDKKLKYRVVAEDTILRDEKKGVDRMHRVGDVVELSSADARKHQEHGVPLTLVEDADSEDQKAALRDEPAGTINEAPIPGDPEAA